MGLIAKTDVFELKLQLDAAVAARISQEVGLASSQEALAGIIGSDAGQLSTLRDDFIVTPPNPTMQMNGLNWLMRKTSISHRSF